MAFFRRYQSGEPLAAFICMLRLSSSDKAYHRQRGWPIPWWLVLHWNAGQWSHRLTLTWRGWWPFPRVQHTVFPERFPFGRAEVAPADHEHPCP